MIDKSIRQIQEENAGPNEYNRSQADIKPFMVNFGRNSVRDYGSDEDAQRAYELAEARIKMHLDRVGTGNLRQRMRIVINPYTAGGVSVQTLSRNPPYRWTSRSSQAEEMRAELDGITRGALDEVMVNSTKGSPSRVWEDAVLEGAGSAARGVVDRLPVNQISKGAAAGVDASRRGIAALGQAGKDAYWLARQAAGFGQPRVGGKGSARAQAAERWAGR